MIFIAISCGEGSSNDSNRKPFELHEFYMQKMKQLFLKQQLKDFLVYNIYIHLCVLLVLISICMYMYNNVCVPSHVRI